VLSDLEVMKAAEVQVWNIGLYDHSFKPYENGLLDPRMVSDFLIYTYYLLV